MIARTGAIALAAAVAYVALVSCTTTTTTGVTDPSLVRSKTETTGTGRARIHTELGGGYYARGQYEIAIEELDRKSVV